MVRGVWHYLEIRPKGMAEGKCTIRLVEEGQFVHVLRIFNSNIKGTMKVGFALSHVKGLGIRLAHVLLRVARIDPSKRAGELSPEEVNRLNEIVANPQGPLVPPLILSRPQHPRLALQPTARSQGREGRDCIGLCSTCSWFPTPGTPSCVRTWSACANSECIVDSATSGV